MNSEEIQKEIFSVLEQAEVLREKAELQDTTVEFLKKESEKLEKRAKEGVNFEEQELLAKQISALHTRLVNEVAMIEADIPKLNQLEEKINYLTELAKKTNF